ncbi:hypothetical protein [Brachyspira murdochii]|uniref:Uncharacterized protein n=1 Tax=Brachyspira murdochii TaxID=84378 RepID=A0ABX5B7C4_9SPIR|nr:hypothetical protein [Brachyspira murdochii]PPS23249.1 hypothetical protein DJ52_00105 [Brachyspira murdochii]
MGVYSIYSSDMFPLTRHMTSAGLNVYNSSAYGSAQSAEKVASMVIPQGASVAINNNIGKSLDVYA